MDPRRVAYLIASVISLSVTATTSGSACSQSMGKVRMPHCCVLIPSANVSRNCGGFGQSRSLALRHSPSILP